MMGGENDATVPEARNNRISHDHHCGNDSHSISEIASPMNAAAAVVTPAKQQDEPIDVSVASPPSATVIQHTDVRTRKLGVEAELEALRSKQLAKNIRNDIVDNGETVPMSSSQVQEFYLRKNQMDKAWRQKQQDSIAYLHSYKNHAVAMPRRTTKREFSSKQQANVYSEMDFFFQQQRALNQEWKRQQQDSKDYLHKYRDNTAAGVNGGGSNNDDGAAMMVTPGGALKEAASSDYDIQAAIAFYERQKLLDERLARAVNCPLPPDDDDSLSESVEETIDGASLDSTNLNDSLTKLLQVANEPNSSSDTEEIYEDSATSVEEEYRVEQELELVNAPSRAKAIQRVGQVEIFEDSLPSTEVNSVEGEPVRIVATALLAEGTRLDNNDFIESEASGFYDDDDDLLNELLADHANEERNHSETQGLVVRDNVPAQAATTEDAFGGEMGGDGPLTTPEKPSSLDDESLEGSNGLNEFDRLVTYMSTGRNADNAPDNLEELLRVENDGEDWQSHKKTTMDVTDAVAQSSVENVTSTLEETVAAAESEVPMKLKKNATTQTPATPTRMTERGESKIAPPREQMSKTSNHSSDSSDDGLPHYMKLTMSTPERKTKVTSPNASPVKPLYSRRETAESFKKKANKCTNKWIPSLFPSRGGCERCLYFADEEELRKFERDGHYYRIWSTKGGCTRSCPCFPRRPNQPPVRLCRKCFYDTHRLGKM